MNTPTYSGTSERKRFFVENDEGDTFPVTIIRNMVIISTFGVKVVFRKTNRGSMVHDSRTPKKPLTSDEAHSELCRMLGEEKGENAYRELMI